MIDIHAHILPNIDDGPSSLDESIKMIELAIKSGVKAIVATPHSYMLDLKTNASLPKEKFLYDFKEEVVKRNLFIDILPGAEILVTSETPLFIHEKNIFTINNTKYVLIEFPFSDEPWWIEYIICEFLDNNYIPIIAHPERYHCVLNDPSLVYEWISMGSLIQLNKGSILGDFGKNIQDVAAILLNHNLCTCIASDSHHEKQRTPDMYGIKNFIKHNYSYEYFNLLLRDNPEKIISGKNVTHLKSKRICL